MTERRRIHFTTWGQGVERLDLAIYAVARDDETDIQAVVRSVQRTTRLVCCGRVRRDGTALLRGHPSAHQYTVTLGRPCPGGGFTPVVQIFFDIPIGADR